MQLILIRHLPTEWNKKGLLQGSQDIPILEITKEFEQEVKKNKELLHQQFNKVYASSLVRTQQTAHVYGYEPKVNAKLNELCFGQYEGKQKNELIQNEDWLENPRKLILGESLLSFEKRILSFLEEVKDQQNVLVFGHGSWMRALLSLKHIGDVNDMNRIKVKNNELIDLQFAPNEIEDLMNRISSV